MKESLSLLRNSKCLPLVTLQSIRNIIDTYVKAYFLANVVSTVLG